MKKTLLLLLSVVIFAPVFVSAESHSGGQMMPGGQQPSTPTTANVPRATLENPLKGVDSLAGLFTKLAQFVLNVSYVVIAFFLLLSGFKFIKAQGSETELEDAKRTFFNTIIGAIIIISAQTIILVVQGIIEGLQG